MTPAAWLAEWLDVRANEVRIVLLTFLGAFVMMAFVVLARALREAFFLDLYDASFLPYVGGASIALGLIGAWLFSRASSKRHPQALFRALTAGLAIALGALYPALGEMRASIVLFYLVTAVGTLLLTSGFWLVVSELFAVREAKRLFGLVSAGGTLGLLVAGSSLGPLLSLVEPRQLLFGLVALLGAGLLINENLPRDRLGGEPPRGETPERPGNALELVLRARQVRLIATVFVLVSAVSAIVDFQFKEAAQEAIGRGPEMAAFFGDFYAWTGGIAFLIQLFVTTRLLAAAGIARSIALVPIVVALGSVGMFAAPGLVVATALRGADSTLRKSIFRSVMEFLWVPVPHAVRRRTKTLVDTVADALGEGFGVLIVFLWVTLPGLPSRWLSLFVIAVCSVLVLLSTRIGREYFATLRARLAVRSERDRILVPRAGSDARGHTLSRLDVTRVLRTGGIDLGELDFPAHERPHPAGGRGEAGDRPTRPADDDVEAILHSGDEVRILEILVSNRATSPDLVPALVRLLARDRLMRRTTETLAELGGVAVAPLAARLIDESSDFVIRRRIPRVLARIDDPAAHDTLLQALEAGRFEVRYRAALALAERRRNEFSQGSLETERVVWAAIRSELGRGRAVWELARLLDDVDPDPLLGATVQARGSLSLEHVFRLLTLVLDAEAIRSAYASLLSEDDEARSFALEYLEHVLPPDVRSRLWPFIGDLSVAQERRSRRPLGAVVEDLMRTGATLFGQGQERDALRRYLDETGRRDDRAKQQSE